MIIFREKLFRRDEFSDDKILDADSKLLEEFGELKIQLELSDKYKKDLPLLGMKGSPNRNRLDKLREDLLKSFLTEDGPAGGETHYLGDYSKSGKFYTFSKKITDEHRLNYRVYPPEIIINKGVRYYVQRVVLDSCFGHELTEGDYLNDKELRERKDRMRKNAPYRKPESILSGKNTKNYRGRKNRK